METSITGRTVITVVMFSIVLVIICSSAFAQVRKINFKEEHPSNGVYTAGVKTINHASEVNLKAKAVPLNSAINSGYYELKPSLTPDGKRLYFSRIMHPNNTGGEADLEDIWFSDFDETTGEWSDPAVLKGHLNNAAPNYIHNVSATGDTVILGNQYLKKGKMRAGLSYSVNVNGNWSFPTPIFVKNDYNISDQANSYVSLKNGVIIRAIQRDDSFGGRDLYVCFWDGHEASVPMNLGEIVNSDLEESSPYLDEDGKTLYFASKGHNGYGGYDIWVTKRLDDSWANWSTPRNLGPAVNGPLDDEFFTITHCGSYAIFSKEVSIHNIDLYRISVQELFDLDKMEDEQKLKFSPVVNRNSSMAKL